MTPGSFLTLSIWNSLDNRGTLSAEGAALEPATHDPITRLAFAPLVLTPREAASRPTRPVALESALGQLAGEIVTVYPPGIPLICPGERFTPEVIDELVRLRALEAPLLARDPTIETVLVLA